MSKLPCVISYKFSQLCFCQILFELVYSWECYHINYKGELFIETQCRMKIAVFEGVTLVQNFRYKGAFPWTIFNVAKLGESISLCCKNTGRNFVRFVTIHAFDRRTDKRTYDKRSWLCLHSYSAVNIDWTNLFFIYYLLSLLRRLITWRLSFCLSVCLLATNYSYVLKTVNKALKL